jgi:hypothetical protein
MLALILAGFQQDILPVSKVENYVIYRKVAGFWTYY